MVSCLLAFFHVTLRTKYEFIKKNYSQFLCCMRFLEESLHSIQQLFLTIEAERLWIAIQIVCAWHSRRSEWITQVITMIL